MADESTSPQTGSTIPITQPAPPPNLPPPPPTQPAGDAAKAVPAWMSYAVGGKSDSGDTIVDILQRLHKCFVFINQDKTLSWEYDNEACIDADDSGAQATLLISQVNTSIWGARRRRRVFGPIADALANALSTRRADDKRDFFKDARALVEATRAETLHLTYLAAAFTTTLIVVGVLVTIMNVAATPPVQLYVLSSALAAVGAFLSVLMRFRTLQIDTYTSHVYTTIGGVSRVLMGAVFGAIFLLFHQAELLLTAIKGTHVLAAASLLSGFSERLIPELLAAFETKLGGAK